MRYVLTVLLAACAPGAAQDRALAALEKSPRHLEWVDVDRGGRKIATFVAYPQSPKKAAAVIVVHEIYGLTDWVRSVADELAAAGYIALAPDLLSGRGPGGGRTSAYPTVEAAREAVSKLDAAEVGADLDAVADYAKGLAASNGKLAVAGFCWGGGQAFRFARREDLGAAFVFYGPGPKDVSELKAPVHAFYAGNDARINAAVPELKAAMKAAGKTYEPLTYEGASHAFMRKGADPAGDAVDRKAAKRAWKRWLKLLKKL